MNGKKWKGKERNLKRRKERTEQLAANIRCGSSCSRSCSKKRVANDSLTRYVLGLFHTETKEKPTVLGSEEKERENPFSRHSSLPFFFALPLMNFIFGFISFSLALFYLCLVFSFFSSRPERLGASIAASCHLK